jgi:hypothetical protein
LITLARLFYARIAGCDLAKNLPNYSKIKKQLQIVIAELNKDEIYFDDMKLPSEIKEALKPFLKVFALNNGDRLLYLRDKRLKHAIEKSLKDIESKDGFDIDDIETDLTFDGPEPMQYKY